MAIRYNSRTTRTELEKVFCRWSYFHLCSKYFSVPLTGGAAIAPIVFPIGRALHWQTRMTYDSVWRRGCTAEKCLSADFCKPHKILNPRSQQMLLLLDRQTPDRCFTLSAMDAASVINTSLSIVYESLSLNVTACDLEQPFRFVTTVHIIGLYGSRSIALCIVASGQPLLSGRRVSRVAMAIKRSRCPM